MTYSVMAGVTNLGYANFIESNQLPEQMFIMFVDKRAYDGDKMLNPFNFEKHQLLEASIITNNVHYPATPITNTSTSGKEREFYEFFLKNTGADHFNSQAVNISYEEYNTKGYFILAFDRTASRNNRFTRHSMDHGPLSINLRHDGDTPHALQVIVYASYSDMIDFDGSSVATGIL